MDDADVIGAFSEEHAERLTGVSIGQMRRWDRLGLLRPSYSAKERHIPYGRVYSFRDLVSLRVLNQLRNEIGVSMAHILSTHQDILELSAHPWAAVRLEVLGKKIVVVEPGSRRRRMAGSGQGVLDVPLQVIIASVRSAVAKMNERGSDEVGRVVRARFVSENQPVMAGTRIPVSSIKSFAAAGYSTAAITKEYPDLTAADVRAALAYGHGGAAA